MRPNATAPHLFGHRRPPRLQHRRVISGADSGDELWNNVWELFTKFRRELRLVWVKFGRRPKPRSPGWVSSVVSWTRWLSLRTVAVHADREARGELGCSALWSNVFDFPQRFLNVSFLSETSQSARWHTHEEGKTQDKSWADFYASSKQYQWHLATFSTCISR